MSVPRFGSISGQNVIAGPQVSGDGVMNVNFYGDGLGDRCLADLRSTDPYYDKIRIEQTRGGLLRDAYRWVLENPEFRRWCDDQESRLLWIKGDPGKGKTMLLCGIIDELHESIKAAPDTDAGRVKRLSFFFCQATDTRINSATSVLRGLIYLLVSQQPALLRHVQERYKIPKKELFEGVNAWPALSEIFTSILEDPDFESSYLVIDALDECVIDLDLLLQLIATRSSASARVKWIVSSRNRPDVEEQLQLASRKVSLCLELNEDSITAAVGIYIDTKVAHIAQLKRYDDKTKDLVRQYLRSNADDTFLWVALACQHLAKVPRWEVGAKLQAIPPGLYPLYQRMLDQIYVSGEVDRYRRILVVMSTAYRPISLAELTCYVDELESLADDRESLAEIVGLCGSFLTLRESIVYFVHQSAKDFLLERVFIRPSPGVASVHYAMFSASLRVLSSTLRRDIYGLKSPGISIDEVEQPEPDPLARVRYGCLHWVDHFYDSKVGVDIAQALMDQGLIDRFLRRNFLHWLEALSLLRGMTRGIYLVARLHSLAEAQEQESLLRALIRDAFRFVQFHGNLVEENPLQVYASALIFSPNNSMIRSCFRTEEPEWIISKPTLDDDWSPCLLAIKAHHRRVTCLAWSPRGDLLASASGDRTVRIWDSMTGQCLSKLDGHVGVVMSISWSRNAEQLVSLSADNTVRVWGLTTGHCELTFNIYDWFISSVVWAPHGALVASLSSDTNIRIWHLASSATALHFKARVYDPLSVTLSPDGTRLGLIARHTGSQSYIKIWDTSTSQVLWMTDTDAVAICWPPATSTFAIISSFWVSIWDMATHQQVAVFQGVSHMIDSMGWSPDGSLVAMGMDDLAVKIFDPTTGEVSVLRGHQDRVTSVAWPSKPVRLASASANGTIMIWDLEGAQPTPLYGEHVARVDSFFLSPGACRLAHCSIFQLKIWDVETGDCLFTHSMRTNLHYAAWSPDSTKLSWLLPFNAEMRVWDLRTGLCRLSPEGSTRQGLFLSWSPDGTLSACTTRDTIEITDAGIGQYKRVIPTLYSNEAPAVWSFDATMLASISSQLHGFVIAIWNAITGASMSDLNVLGRRDTPLPACAWSPDGTRIACAPTGSGVRIWNVATRQCILLLHTPGTIFHLAFDASTTRHLHYDRGTLDLDPSALCSLPSATGGDPPSLSPRHVGYGLDDELSWITFEGKPILRLPAQYRPATAHRGTISYGISGRTLVIGLASGRIMIFKFR